MRSVRNALTLICLAVMLSSFIYRPLFVQCRLQSVLVLKKNVDDEWVEEQVAFRYGVYYAAALRRNWTSCRPQVPCLKLNESLKVSHLMDRHNEALSVIQAHDRYHRLDKQHSFPLLLEDTSVRGGACIIGHNRPFGDRSIILIPLGAYALWYSQHAYDDTPWEAKTPRLLWRGSTTGAISRDWPGRSNRFQIVQKWWKRHPEIDLALTQIVGQTESDIQRLNLTSYLAPSMPINEQRQYKYLLSIEGNDWASNLPWILASNSVPFCVYPFTFENIYWGSGLQPWVHFVPVAQDASDLLEKLHWCQQHDADCHEISQSANRRIRPFLNQTLLNAVMDRWVDLWDFRQ